MGTPGGFRPTHVVPGDGMPTWTGPDPAAVGLPLDPLLPVVLAEANGNWARIVCSNGWTAWVDGRLLVALPQRPPTAGLPLTAGEDPRPLLATLERGLASYRRLLDDYAAGRIDLQAFRDRTRDLRLGAVIDGTSAWLLDLDQGRWYYCDAAQVQSYAVAEGEERDSGGGQEPGVGGESGRGGEPGGGSGAGRGGELGRGGVTGGGGRGGEGHSGAGRVAEWGGPGAEVWDGAVRDVAEHGRS
ncbi:hypothetical protein [Kitasatospora cheerisanensis]|uniref:Uncharacterized protein n=1 Tax=Kitasatospora cheerisanensis KCTC 2395 TaxID=1348663 RepID=A0A066Z334_9ACTN|nr:hypothetical protein [Kitasatospora cheerisanensis]KDN87927.1 hypothetical protein KCH_03400 [Kitasatospora cheerisanensis KCTC 2395]